MTQDRQQRYAAAMAVLARAAAAISRALKMLAEQVRAWVRAMRPLVERIRAATPGDPFWVARLDGRR